MFNSTLSFYRSKEWNDLRKSLMLQRANENGDVVCEHCGKVIVHPYDCIAHHVIPLTEANVNDYNISLNPENIQLVCHKSHNEIHNRFGTYNRHIRIIYGSPCSGKTTFVQDSAGKDDLVLDIDKIYQAISVNDLHVKSNRLTSNVFQIRDLILDMIKTRNGRWINAWIIIANCRAMDLERLKNSLNAELIRIDTSKEECLERLMSSDDGRNKQEYAKYIENYFNDWERHKDLLLSL